MSKHRRLQLHVMWCKIFKKLQVTVLIIQKLILMDEYIAEYSMLYIFDELNSDK